MCDDADFFSGIGKCNLQKYYNTMQREWFISMLFSKGILPCGANVISAHCSLQSGGVH